jgi:hypothetical protein
MLMGCGAQLLPRNRSRQLAEEFIQALQGQASGGVSAYLTPDANVFLQGSAVALNAADFNRYVDQQRQQSRTLRARGPVYLKDGGAGWLLELGPSAIERTNADPAAAELWMEVRFRDDRISRVWIHFTAESLTVLRWDPGAYADAAAQRGMPVPTGWAMGTPTLLAEAEQTDRQQSTFWNVADVLRSATTALAGLLGLLLIVGFGLMRSGSRFEPRSPARRSQLMSKLRESRGLD